MKWVEHDKKHNKVVQQQYPSEALSVDKHHQCL